MAEDYPIHDEWEKEEAFYKEEAEWHKQMAIYAEFCPVCGVHCGPVDFEPDDPSVGIFGYGWTSECPTHGLYQVQDDLSVWWEEERA